MRATLPSGRLSWSFILSNPIVRRLTWFSKKEIWLAGKRSKWTNAYQRRLIDNLLAIHFGWKIILWTRSKCNVNVLVAKCSQMQISRPLNLWIGSAALHILLCCNEVVSLSRLRVEHWEFEANIIETTSNSSTLSPSNLNAKTIHLQIFLAIIMRAFVCNIHSRIVIFSIYL